MPGSFDFTLKLFSPSCATDWIFLRIPEKPLRQADKITPCILDLLRVLL
jgi:hypothetical protein